MKKKQDPQLSPEEELRAENNVLKVKLKMEYGMQDTDTSSLPPHVENEWLKYINAFEQQYKDAKVTSVYDFIGRPTYSKWDALTHEQIAVELERLRAILEANDVALDCICEYDDAVIYRFLTEELFSHEMDLIRIPGMTHHFIYEEFHPNHDHDLRRETERLLTSIFEKEWNEEYDERILSREICWAGKSRDRRQMSAIITAFQEAHRSLVISSLDIREVHIDLHAAIARVSCAVSVFGKTADGLNVTYEGPCLLHLVSEYDSWFVSEFSIPGLGSQSG